MPRRSAGGELERRSSAPASPGKHWVSALCSPGTERFPESLLRQKHAAYRDPPFNSSRYFSAPARPYVPSGSTFQSCVNICGWPRASLALATSNSTREFDETERITVNTATARSPLFKTRHRQSPRRFYIYGGIKRSTDAIKGKQSSSSQERVHF